MLQEVQSGSYTYDEGSVPNGLGIKWVVTVNRVMVIVLSSSQYGSANMATKYQLCKKAG